MSVCAAGFGSFVDKVVLPYTSTNPKRVQKPCPDNEKFCQPAFGYKHVLSMTDNEILFNEKVSEQAISGNLDVPEGGLDAIMQAAVCGVGASRHRVAGGGFGLLRQSSVLEAQKGSMLASCLLSTVLCGSPLP